MSLLHITSKDKNSFKVTWEIDTSLIIRTSKYRTPEKVVDGMPDVKWQLSWKKQSRGYIDFWFSIKCKNPIQYTIRPEFPFLIDYTRKSHEVLKRFCSSQSFFQLLNVQLNEVLKAAQNGTITIEFNNCFWYQNKDTNTASILRELVEDPQELGSRLLKDDDYKDFSILVDEKTIMIHKLIFAIESPVFARMFEDNFKEAQEKKVTITDFKYEIVQAAVDYCYRQEISNLMKDFHDVDNLIQLLYFADKYDFQTLKSKLERLCSEKLTQQNVATFATAAEETNSIQLQEACGDSIRSWLNKKQRYTAQELANMDLKALVDALPEI